MLAQTPKLGGYPTEAAVPSRELMHVQESLASLVNALQKHACQIENALDRLHGSRPQSVSKDQTQPEPSNLISALRSGLERLASVDAHLSDIAARIDTIV